MGIFDFFGGKTIKKYKEKIRENPKDAEAHFYLATVYEKKGNIREAIKEFNEVLKISPRSAETHFNLAVLYEEQKDGRKAIVHILKAGNLFGEKGDVSNKERSRKRSREYYEKYGFEPEDFPESDQSG